MGVLGNIKKFLKYALENQDGHIGWDLGAHHVGNKILEGFDAINNTNTSGKNPAPSSKGVDKKTSPDYEKAVAPDGTVHYPKKGSKYVFEDDGSIVYKDKEPELYRYVKKENERFEANMVPDPSNPEGDKDTYVTKAEAAKIEADINEAAIHGQAGFIKEGGTYTDKEGDEQVAGAGGHWVTPTELDAAGQVLVDKSREERDRAVSGLGAKQQSRYTGLMDKILMSGGDMGSAERMAKQAERTTGMENQMLGGQYQSQLGDIEAANLKDQTNWQQSLQGLGMQTDLAQQQYERGVEEFDDEMRQKDEMRQLQLMIANQQAQQQANSARSSGWGTMGGMLGMGIGALVGGGPWGMALGQYAGSSLGQGLGGMGGNASYTPMTMPASTQW